MTHNTSDYGERIRAQGFRLTPQRQMVLDAICELGGHVTPEAIYERVRTKSLAVNRATVYRNLDFLCEVRLVVAAHRGYGSPDAVRVMPALPDGGAGRA